MRRPASLLLALALVLPACARTDTPSPTARASTPTALQGIADAYLELAAPFNAATCNFNAVLSQSAPTLADLKRASADYRESLRDLITGLRRLDWPTELGDDASALIYALGTNVGHTGNMARAETLSEFIAADDRLIAANKVSAAAAKQLRTDLGLPTGGNLCD